MNIEIVREFCIAKKAVTESFPFDEDTLVYKVMGKIFALTSLQEPNTINLKCDPERAIELRAKYESVEPGFHMNKTHWNTITYNQDLADKDILDLISHSYDLVFASLSKKQKLEFESVIK